MLARMVLPWPVIPPRTAGVLPRTSALIPPPHLCRYAWLRGHCVDLWLLPWACGLRASLTRGQHKAAAEEVEVRSAKHLALQHFEAIDMPLDRARIPGQRHPSFDRLVILVEPGREASYGVHSTRGGALQPGIEALGLPLADEGREILRQVDRLGDVGLLRPQMGELLRLSGGALRLAPQHQPGGPARRQGLARWLGHGRQELACAAVPGGQALGLPQTAGIGRDDTIAASIAIGPIGIQVQLVQD